MLRTRIKNFFNLPYQVAIARQCPSVRADLFGSNVYVNGDDFALQFKKGGFSVELRDDTMVVIKSAALNADIPLKSSPVAERLMKRINARNRPLLSRLARKVPLILVIFWLFASVGGVESPALSGVESQPAQIDPGLMPEVAPGQIQGEPRADDLGLPPVPFSE